MQLKKVGGIVCSIILCITGSTPFSAQAQKAAIDSLHLTIPQAEEIFLKKNLTLLANQYNIDINKALVKQAKVWDNPTLNTDQNIYDGKFFRHTTVNGFQYGQVYVQLQQLIRTAGKRNKLAQLAQDNVQTSEAQFNDVMRSLKFILSTDMNNLAQLQGVESVYKDELHTMQTLVKGMDEMLKVGDISQKENVRIKALMFSLQSDYTDNIRQQDDLQKELRTMLQLNDSSWIVSDAAEKIDQSEIEKLSIGGLQDSAVNYRPDIAIARSQLFFQQHNLAYQKALVVPDVTVGVEYDRLNSYVPNYYGLAVSLPLPLLNKNKGNISAAQIGIKQANTIVQQTQMQVTNEVANASQKLFTISSLLNDESTSLQNSYDTLLKNMTESYKLRKIGLIEFIDFFDAWKDTRNRQLQQVANQRNAAAELNYTTNQPIIKL